MSEQITKSVNELERALILIDSVATYTDDLKVKTALKTIATRLNNTINRLQGATDGRNNVKNRPSIF